MPRGKGGGPQPLDIAAARGALPVVELLVQSGGVLDAGGASALEAARVGGHAAVAEWIGVALGRAGVRGFEPAVAPAAEL